MSFKVNIFATLHFLLLIFLKCLLYFPFLSLFLLPPISPSLSSNDFLFFLFCRHSQDVFLLISYFSCFIFSIFISRSYPNLSYILALSLHSTTSSSHSYFFSSSFFFLSLLFCSSWLLPSSNSVSLNHSFSFFSSTLIISFSFLSIFSIFRKYSLSALFSSFFFNPPFFFVLLLAFQYLSSASNFIVSIYTIFNAYFSTLISYFFISFLLLIYFFMSIYSHFSRLSCWYPRFPFLIFAKVSDGGHFSFFPRL